MAGRLLWSQLHERSSSEIIAGALALFWMSQASFRSGWNGFPRHTSANEKNQTRIIGYLEFLSSQERLEMETAALSASPLGRGQISLRLRQSIIDNYVLDILHGRSAPE
jgi:hypothetical protein